MLQFREGSSSYEHYKKAIRKAKEAIDDIIDITEEMEEQFGGYGERDWDEHKHYDGMWERRRRY